VKILLIDGNNLGWRGFGQAPLTYDGMRTEMIFIGLNMIRKYIADFEPDDCCIVWDGGHDSRRKKLFPQYKEKKKRELTEVEEHEKDAFFWQLKEFQKVLSSFEIPQIRCKGREADDVIFNIIANHKSAPGSEFILVSTDKDFYQLLDCPKNVRIYSPGKKKEVAVEDVEKEFGIPIEHYVDYKAMVGDPSDNLPGITGIGPVAAKWLVNNLICGTGGNATKSNMRIIDLLHINIKTFKLMCELIRFMSVDPKEIETGKFGTRTHAMAGYQERILWVLEKYGFDRFLDKFEWFFSPFEILWRKNEKSNLR